MAVIYSWQPGIHLHKYHNCCNRYGQEDHYYDFKNCKKFYGFKITMSWIYMGYEFSCMKKWAQNRVEFKWTWNTMLHFHAEIKQNQFNNRKLTLFLKCSMFKSQNVTGVKHIRIYVYTYAFARGRKEDIVVNFFVKCISRLNLNFHYAQTEFET